MHDPGSGTIKNPCLMAGGNLEGGWAHPTVVCRLPHATSARIKNAGYTNFYLSVISSASCTWNWFFVTGPKRTPARWVRCQAHCCCFIFGAGCESAASDQASRAVYLYWLRFYFPPLWLINRERKKPKLMSCRLEVSQKGSGEEVSLARSKFCVRGACVIYRALIWVCIHGCGLF